MGSMRKEVAVGFSVITALLLVLGVLLYRRATAMWQTPEADAMAAANPVQPIVPIDGRPRVVVAQDDQPLDDDSRGPDARQAGAEEPYVAPTAREERLHSSFLPRQFEQSTGDPDSQTDETIGERDPSSVDADPGQAPADADASLSEPSADRQTSLEVADGDFAQAESGGQFSDFQRSGSGLPEDPATMTPDPSEQPGGQDWPASGDRDTADAQITSGSLPAEASDRTYNQDGIADRAGTDYREFDRRDANAGGREGQFGRAHQEPERVAVEHGKYTVVPNDNYWIVAEKIYGNGAYFKALFEHNRFAASPLRQVAGRRRPRRSAGQRVGRPLSRYLPSPA